MGVRRFLPENVQEHLRPVYRRARRYVEWDAQPKHLLSAWRLTRLKNHHCGQRCFVVGNGLSLDGMDLRPLAHEHVISLNRGYSLLGKFGITPRYHVCVNKMIVARCAGQLAHLPAIKFISWQAREMLPLNRDTILLRALESVCFSKNLQDGVVVQVMPYWPRTLGRSLFDGVWGSGTAVYVALQVAFYLGFRQVVLLGVDHDFRVPGDCLTTNTISSTNDWGEANPARWARFHWRLFDLETSELAYHLARIAFEEDGREIVDATLNGRLEEFRKVRYKDLIKE